jgi:hypothetical protein
LHATEVLPNSGYRVSLTSVPNEAGKGVIAP